MDAVEEVRNASKVNGDLVPIIFIIVNVRGERQPSSPLIENIEHAQQDMIMTVDVFPANLTAFHCSL